MRGNTEFRESLARYGPYVPKTLISHFKQALKESDVTSLKGEAALVEALIADAMNGLDPDRWQTLWNRIGQLSVSLDSDSEENRAKCFDQMAEAIRECTDFWKHAVKVLGLIEAKRKIAETEQKRMRNKQMSLDLRQVNALVSLIIQTVNLHVPDQAAREKVAEELSKVVSAGYG